MSYCIDTSSLIEAWERRYPETVFPSLWTRLDELVSEGRLVSPEEVKKEVEKKSDGVVMWTERHTDLFVPIDEAQLLAVADILKAHPSLVDMRRGRSEADPWVVALARTRGLTVITNEQPSVKASVKRIPDVCKACGIECINILEMFKKEKWTF